MTLLDRKSIKLDALKECQWSPRDPMLAAYQAEDATGNRPARVVLIKVRGDHMWGAWHAMSHGAEQCQCWRSVMSSGGAS